MRQKRCACICQAQSYAAAASFSMLERAREGRKCALPTTQASLLPTVCSEAASATPRLLHRRGKSHAKSAACSGGGDPIASSVFLRFNGRAPFKRRQPPVKLAPLVHTAVFTTHYPFLPPLPTARPHRTSTLPRRFLADPARPLMR